MPELRKNQHPLAERGLQPDSLSAQLNMVRSLGNMAEELKRFNIVEATIEHLERERQSRPWSWTTMETNAANVSAGLSRLPQLTGNRHPPVILKQSQEWQDALKTIRRLSKLNAPQELPALTMVQMREAAKSLPQREATILYIAWATAGRIGDVMQLARKHVWLVKRSDDSYDMHVYFARGKIVSKAGPYTTDTQVTAEVAGIIRAEIAKGGQYFLFHAPSTAERERMKDRVREALRKADPAMELRSVRRGAVQHLAAHGATMAELLRYTKHSDIRMLRRYLAYGRAKCEETAIGTSCGARLWRN